MCKSSNLHAINNILLISQSLRQIKVVTICECSACHLPKCTYMATNIGDCVIVQTAFRFGPEMQSTVELCREMFLCPIYCMWPSNVFRPFCPFPSSV